MDAIILAGGDGKRLGMNIPKALVPIGGKTLLQRQVEYLRKQGIENITVCIKEKDIKLFKNEITSVVLQYTKINSYIGYSEEQDKLGTAGAIKRALDKANEDAENVGDASLDISDDFIVLNCDDLVQLNLKKMPVNSIAVTHPRLPFGEIKFKDYSFITDRVFLTHFKSKPAKPNFKGMIPDKTIESFIEKPLFKNLWVSCGWYHLDKSIYKYLPDKGDLEKDVFPKMAKKGLLKAFKYTGEWQTINTAKDYEEVVKHYETKNN